MTFASPTATFLLPPFLAAQGFFHFFPRPGSFLDDLNNFESNTDSPLDPPPRECFFRCMEVVIYVLLVCGLALKGFFF